MDTLTITALRVNTTIGAYAWEQYIKQQLLIDINIHTDFSNCGEILNNTLDYAVLCTLVTEYVEAKSFQLIESVANEVASLIQSHFKIAQLSVSISKPHAVKNAGNIKVTVQRGV